MSISPTRKQVKRAKIESKHLNPTDSEIFPERLSAPRRFCKHIILLLFDGSHLIFDALNFQYCTGHDLQTVTHTL